jgi:hypothetical protein
MDRPLQIGEDESGAPNFTRQAISFAGHSLVALFCWAGLMALGYIVQPAGLPQNVVLAISFGVPLVLGLLVNRFRQDEMATEVWLIGLIWILIVALWVLDMPTGPNECFQCGATEKLIRTFFSVPRPSGLIDNDGPFLGTWPAAALIGYAIGARIALRRRP